MQDVEGPLADEGRQAMKDATENIEVVKSNLAIQSSSGGKQEEGAIPPAGPGFEKDRVFEFVAER